MKKRLQKMFYRPLVTVFLPNIYEIQENIAFWGQFLKKHYFGVI